MPRRRGFGNCPHRVFSLTLFILHALTSRDCSFPVSPSRMRCEGAARVKAGKMRPSDGVAGESVSNLAGRLRNLVFWCPFLAYQIGSCALGDDRTKTTSFRGGQQGLHRTFSRVGEKQKNDRRKTPGSERPQDAWLPGLPTPRRWPGVPVPVIRAIPFLPDKSGGDSDEEPDPAWAGHRPLLGRHSKTTLPHLY